MQLFYEYMLPEKYTNKTREDADCNKYERNNQKYTAVNS